MTEDQNASPAEIYGRYLGSAIADPFARVLLERAAPERGERVLDLACGTGSVARQVAPMVGPAGTVIGVDVNPDMLDVARALPAPTGARIEWQEGNAMALPLPDRAFDLVLCQQGLQFFPDRAAALREIRRVLKGGGRVAVSVWRSLREHPLYEALFAATAGHLGVDPSAVASAFSLGDPEELRVLLSAAGFNEIEITPRSLDVHLEAPERFVEVAVLGAATTIPAFAGLDPGVRARLVEAVAQETASLVRQYRDGDRLTFLMSTNIARAHV
ncbi:class I SAM-dependent methyltransferase [Microvirga massiliensis]|uniref:class I SAM-dependent methyltransferase n=1 Tax=Microvirga massiliensis TaxID=1033741 RepID=UPI00062B7046|nr:class I SAM-dependent methyltransferase [Microvirga massiliensis]